MQQMKMECTVHYRNPKVGQYGWKIWAVEAGVGSLERDL